VGGRIHEKDGAFAQNKIIYIVTFPFFINISKGAVALKN